MPKIVPKSVKRVLNMFWGNFSEKIFCPVFHGGSSLQKSSKTKNFQYSKNAQNRSQKCPNVFWTCFRVIFRKNFLRSVPWRVDSSKFSKEPKNFQNSKISQNRSRKCPNVFWTWFGVIFSEKFFAQCSMEGRVFENFQKNQKIFKNPKTPKIVPKSVQTCFEHVLG